MKKLITCFILLLMISTSFSQGFVKKGKQWNILEEMNFGPTLTTIYRIGDDTTVNDLNYKKVWYCQDSSFSDAALFGLIREENERIFFVDNNSNSEHLLYDFNIETGDTVHVFSLPYQGDCEVELVCISIDTVNYFDIPRKVWSFASYDSEVWIEGIGNANGLFQNRYYECLIDVYYELLCSYDGDSLIYQNPDGYPCYINTVGIKEVTDKTPVKIFPNPVPRGYNIRLTSSVTIKSVTVYTVGGKELRPMTNFNNTNITIETSGLPKGMYVLMIGLADDSMVMEKLIVY